MAPWWRCLEPGRLGDRAICGAETTNIPPRPPRISLSRAVPLRERSLTADELASMRSRLCLAALDIFREKGLEAVTFRALAEVLGISHTLPYRYFENKDALLASVRVLCFERFEEFVRRYEPVDAPALDRALAVVDAYVRFVIEHPVDYTLIFATPQPPPVRYPELLAARRSLFEHCVDLVQFCIDQDLVKGDAREITHAIWGAVHGLLTLHVANQLVHGYELQALVRPTIQRILGASVGELDQRVRLPASVKPKSSSSDTLAKTRRTAAVLATKRKSKST